MARREAFLMGGPEDGRRYVVDDQTNRMAFLTPLHPLGVQALREVKPDAPVPFLEHRYDYAGERLSDGSCVFNYTGLHPEPTDG